MRMDYVHTAFDPSKSRDGCLSKAVCRKALRKIQADAIDFAGAEGKRAGLFMPLDEILNRYEGEGAAADPAKLTLCGPCMKGVDTTYMVYESLPGRSAPMHFDSVAIGLERWARPDSDESDSEPELHRLLREEGERVLL